MKLNFVKIFCLYRYRDL